LKPEFFPLSKKRRKAQTGIPIALSLSKKKKKKKDSHQDMPTEQQSSSTGNQKLALSRRFIYHIVSKSGSYQICLLGSIFKPTTISKKKNKT